MTLKQFKEEFRMICTDTWGDAMDAWFECAGRLHLKKQKLPESWQYKPPVIGSPCVKDSHFYNDFKATPKNQLWEIGLFLYRYCLYLQYKGKSY